jgi:peptidoglycan hydrolase CwlO-like protein
MFSSIVNIFANNGAVVMAFATTCIFAAFIGEIDMRNREVSVLKDEKALLEADVNRLREERDAVEEQCEELETENEKLKDAMEKDLHVIEAREQLAAERKAREEDAVRFEGQVDQKGEAVLIMLVFGFAGLIFGALVSLVVILKSSGCTH